MTFTFGSLFAGIGGLDLGLERAELAGAWQVEIDAKCNEVLAHHWPDVKRYGDVNDVGRRNLEPVDVLVGGFPCQDLSVAGRRAGLAGERSGLWWQFLRVIEELEPKWAVIENVPGLLSSNGGRDMGTLVGSLEECGYRWAYRVLDAQFHGVAQRRRRVFIVAGRGGRRPEEILFERESSPWDSAPSRETGERIAADAGISFKKRGGFGVSEYRGATGTLEHEGGTHQGGPERIPMIATPWDIERCRIVDARGVCKTLAADKGRGHGVPTIATFQNTGHGWWNESDVGQAVRTPEGGGSMEANVVAFAQNTRDEVGLQGGDGQISGALSAEPGMRQTTYVALDLRNSAESDVAQTLQGAGQGEGRGRCINAIPHVVTGFDRTKPTVSGDVAGTLRSNSARSEGVNDGKADNQCVAFRTNQTGAQGPIHSGGVTDSLAQDHPPAIAFTERTRAEGRNLETQEELAYAITNPGSGGRTHSRQIAGQFGVRRLTPTECERLQGFPDGWTDVNGMSDSARYRMLGNAVAVPVAEWIGRRIMETEATA